ncbi:GNAT family N-acetyltransferase [Comamonas sp. JC664]|uniref:GNAT family N-acetyltransferase n=1 Tax=Comamonas sp. JC664 TaxID=2801917 RepID=UPI00174A04DB|nr:GNAT family N-acetyltransferase [Comamonas sp. JC664]MBL0694703.1 GNAT family N-acetyltransferase [Comamonas sp. JC664]GHG94126.1 N-acetyltransferase [Comamonas sp. KCTC 72670]
MSTEALTLRRIDARDDTSVADIIRTVMPEFGADGPGFAIHDPEVSAMTAAYSRPRHAYFVVERAGRIIGGGGIAPLEGGDAGVCELRKMYFLPEARGLGLGERLLRHCLEFARDAGFRTCYLETLAGMNQAQKLYRRMGFEPLCAPMGNTGHFGCDHWYSRDLSLPLT